MKTLREFRQFLVKTKLGRLQACETLDDQDAEDLNVIWSHLTVLFEIAKEAKNLMDTIEWARARGEQFSPMVNTKKLERALDYLVTDDEDGQKKGT